VESLADLARVLRELRRRHARRTGGAELTYRQLAAATGWSHGIIGEYLSGKVLPPTERFDTLVRLLGATPAEQGALATARDRVEERRRRALPGGGSVAELPSPRQLPADVPGFTGQADHLAALDALLDRREALPICAVTGSPGVGKTTLAIHWGHSVAGRFPDGQLYLDLRGYDPDRPVPPGAALAVFLRGLGLAATLVPRTIAERAACYRTLLADRRMLVVLDNAYSADQVRPLLPGTPASAVVVTSRDDLAGLVARDGAHRIELDALSTTEAVALLRALVGARVDADPAAAAAVAQRCARLPLALRVAAEIATANPDLTLAELGHELVLAATGDRRTAVRAVFSWSYRRLGAGAARGFAALGLHPGRDFDVHATAALAGSTMEVARAVVDELRRAHLVERAGPGAYRMHDLLRAYAAEQAGGWAAAAVARLYSYYLDTAWRATRTLFPHDRRPAAGTARVPMPAVDEPAQAQRWLDGQRTNLVAVAEHAARHGSPRHCVDLSQVLWRYLEVGGHYQEALALHTAAVAAAPRGSEAEVLANLGGVHWWLGSYQEALDCFARARTGHRRCGDREGEARALARVGVVHERLGDYGAALRHMREALDIYRATGNHHGEGAQLVNLGAVHRRMGDYEESAAHQRRAAAVFAELGDRRLVGYARGNLGAVYGLLGREAEALDLLHEALRHCRDSADRGGEGSALSAIGAIHARLGDHPEALEKLHSALAISREIADRSVETETLNTLGETLRAMGEPAAAAARHRAALALARQTGDRYERARALDGAARATAALGQRSEAGQYIREALDAYRGLAVPEAEEARAFSKELR
jgi:tetratricopeptide (TPR) repeat protein